MAVVNYAKQYSRIDGNRDEITGFSRNVDNEWVKTLVKLTINAFFK